MATSGIQKCISEQQKGFLSRSCRYFITHIFNYVIEPHHENILAHAETCSQTLDLAPRGCGKSRIVTVGYAAWRALIDPNIRILIVSDTDEHSTRFLGTIKTALKNHPVINQHFGTVEGDKWTDHQIVLAGRTKILTEATITALVHIPGRSRQDTTISSSAMTW